MSIRIVQWAEVHTRLLRTGWVWGWVGGVWLAAASMAAGSTADLSVIRALTALMGLVLVAHFTGVGLGITATAMITRVPKGGLVDTVVGDEAEEPDQEDETAPEKAEPEADAA